MKKLFLLLVPFLALGLASCDPDVPPEPDFCELNPDDPSCKEEPPVDYFHDVTINVTAAGITTFEGNHTHLWINSPIATENRTEGSLWGSSLLVQDDVNPNLWSISIPDVEENSYEYNVYYGGSTFSSIEWSAGIAEETVSSLVVTATTTTFNVTKTFNVPATFRDVRVVVTPVILETSTQEVPTALHASTVVWAWISGGVGNVALTKDVDGTWYVDINNAPVGNNTFSINTTLSTTNIAWTFQNGAWVSGSWTVWSDASKYSVPEGEGKYVIDATFTYNGQPAKVAAEAVSITFKIKQTAWQSGGGDPQLVHSIDGSSFDEGWVAGTWANGTSTHDVTIQAEVGAVIEFYVYIWVSGGSPEARTGKDAGGVNFTLTVSTAQTLTISGSFDAAVNVFVIS